ncbi:DUF4178 domain-containing protein [Uliginosibacterium sp. 31-16]|uniref:DUF4178 domain-containing protein n=1 Tax=Uliginosibacterium sp. 31-16 TaxID=3068315 RepID=UPI00273D4C60|nr:DUF4178 domain-containing protein [Uliginosibacterium sp. 31-16]MDP5238965.1 DUF4178 domain-containing protein [Uliginosibacterium sp. 31-16]
MYKTACPACGAQVEFRSAGSVMAVCAYCRSTLLRDADSVRNIGRMSEVIEDHTRIQITTSGQYEGKNFGVVGRIQLKYEDGFWNEWYVLFDDGTAGWLSDGSGQYALTLPKGTPNKAPTFRQIRPGASIPWDGARFTATDVRTATCVAGEGELPFQVGSGYVVRVADFRSDDRFLTLDYSDGDTPQVFLGTATTLEDLKCQLLRSEDQVKDTAGKLKGKTKALECPNCGSGIDSIPGKAEHLVCPSCHAEVGLEGDKAEVLQKHAGLQTHVTSLQLGDTASLEGVKWQLIGLMVCREFGSDESSVWTEYLLFNASKGFLWLVETDEKWTRTAVLNKLPADAGQSVRFGGKTYTKQWDYGSEVIYAAGAFNWRVKIGDKTQITDFQGPDGTLCKERTAEEITWSLGTDMDSALLAKAFGKAPELLAKSVSSAPSSLTLFAKIASGILIFLNISNIFRGSFGAIVFTGLALLLLWLPVWMGGGTGTDSSDGDEGDEE